MGVPRIEHDAVEVTSPATTVPVSIEDAKDHLRVASTAEDIYIEGLVRAATKEAERFTRRKLLRQTVRHTRDDFPAGDTWTLPRAPVAESSNLVVTYRPSSGGSLTFDSTSYIVDDRSLIGRVVLKEGVSWPSEDLQDANGADIEFTAGYGTRPEDVPADLRHALKLMIASNYEHREDVVVGSQVIQTPRAAESLMWGYRLPEVA